MVRSSSLLALILVSTCTAQDWRAWRGPTSDNHTPDSAAVNVPFSWSETENVLWKTRITGRGHATPIVLNNTIFILTHDPVERTIEILTRRLSDGQQAGRKVVHENVARPNYLHKKNSCASSTLATDGNAIYMAVQVGSSIQASAVGLNGAILWERKVAPYRAGRGWFGYGASPLLLDDVLVVAVDTDNSDTGLYALDKKTGEIKWRGQRPRETGYSSPILGTVGGRRQILLSGGYKVTSYDPLTGATLWDVPATSRTTCGTMVWNDSMAFASGNYPDPGTFGINVSGSDAEVAWENNVKCYEQSMLVVDDYLYGIADSGVAYCWRCTDGKEMWKRRLPGPFSASPLLVGNRIYASNERGMTYVFRATPDRFEKLAENKFGDSSFASPIYADGKLLLRHAKQEAGKRQEYLVAIGK